MQLSNVSAERFSAPCNKFFVCFPALQCWVCENAINNADCLENGRMQRCQDNQVRSDRRIMSKTTEYFLRGCLSLGCYIVCLSIF